MTHDLDTEWPNIGTENKSQWPELEKKEKSTGEHSKKSSREGALELQILFLVVVERVLKNKRKLLLCKIFRDPFGSWVSDPKIADIRTCMCACVGCVGVCVVCVCVFPVALEAQQRYFSYRTILVAIVSQNDFVLVLLGYRTSIARYVAKWGIALITV